MCLRGVGNLNFVQSSTQWPECYRLDHFGFKSFGLPAIPDILYIALQHLAKNFAAGSLDPFYAQRTLTSRVDAVFERGKRRFCAR